MTNPNVPAFPISEEETDRVIAGISIYTGLTKREYFAAMAMQGLCGNEAYQFITASVTAEVACKLADELIKNLNRNQP